ncbi:MAG: transcriptional regulator [Archangium sp.]
MAIGDPQASLAMFLRVLDLNGLLGENGRIRPEVGLVSLGDHFDWGRPEDRESATEDGTRILAWLAAHPPDQVQIIVGNHDLVRVGELSSFTDAQYVEARQLAEMAISPNRVAEFKERYPMLASPAVISRDYSCFDTRQRSLVSRLLKKKRLRLAVAPSSDLLLVHAGVTTEDLEVFGPLPVYDAPTIAATLNNFLDARVAKWKGDGPLDLAPLHELGSAEGGEARGILAHRPANPELKKTDRAARRYDPRLLPSGVTQVIGHINDKKCRELMGSWAETPKHEFGVLRGLKLGMKPKYHARCDDEDRLVFVDGAMNMVAPFEYELFDLELRQRLILR